MTEFVKDKDCLVCGPGVLVELETSVTLEKVILHLLRVLKFGSRNNILFFFAYSLVILFDEIEYKLRT